MVVENFNENWAICEIGDISDKIHYGYTATAKDGDNGAKYLRITDIQEGRVNWDTVPVCEIEEREIKKYQLHSDDLVFARTGGTVGKSYLLQANIPTKAVFASYLIRVKINRNVYPKFIYQFFQSLNYWSQIELGKTGLKTNVNAQILSKLNFNLAPLPEQRAIVAKIEQLFSELDNGIANFKTALEQLKVYRQAVLKKAFEGELTKAWRAKQKDLPTAEELLERIRVEREKAAKAQGKNTKDVPPLAEDELKKLPELLPGRIWVKLGDLVTSTEYGTSAKSKESGKVSVLRMGNIQKGRFDWQDLVYTDDEEETNKYLLRHNDVLFNRTNSPELVGKTAIYKGEYPAIFAGYLIRINYILTLASPDYINYFLNSHTAKVHGNYVKTDGVNQSNINGEKLKNYPFPFCPLEEQHLIVQEIETRFSVCDKVEETIKDSLVKAEALRQSILKKAFEGKLLTEQELEACRQQPDWEPAEKLLERIKEEGGKTARKSKKAEIATVQSF